MKKYFQAPWTLKDLALIALGIVLFGGIAIFLANRFQIQSPIVIFILQWTVILGPLLLLTHFKYHLEWKHFGFAKINPFKAVGIAVLGYIFYIAVNIIISIAMLYFSWKIPGYELQPSIFKLFGNSNLEIIIVGIIAVVVAPFLEEIFFRGFLLRNLCDKVGIVIGSIITALVFSLLHFPWQSIIPIFVLGLIINAIVIRSRSIWPAIIFHILNNSISFTFLLLIEKGIIKIEAL